MALPEAYLSPEARAERAVAEGRGGADALRQAVSREIREAVRAAVRDADEIEKLRQSERHYRVFAEQSSDVFWILGLDMKFSYISPSVERMRGYTPEEVVRQRMDEIFTAESATLIVTSLQRGLEEEAAGLIEPHLWRVLELEQKCKDGRTLWTEAAATWLKNEQGQVVGVLGVTRNIDARKRAEESLRRAHDELERRVLERTVELRRALDGLRASEERARAQYKGVPIPTYTWQRKKDDDSFVLVDWNDAAQEVTRGRIVEYAGVRDVDLFKARPEICADLRRCFSERRAVHRETDYEYQSIGERRRVDATYGFVPPDLVLMHVADITERQQAEERERRHQEELRQADKLAALGALVSGVAHEINNPNHVISLNATTIQALLPELIAHLDRYAQKQKDLQIGRLQWSQVREEAPRLMEDVRMASNRIKRIVTDLKEYARPDSAEPPEPFDLNAAVEDASHLMRTVVRKATRRFELTLAPGMPAFTGRKGRIEQIVVNLLQNACQALPDPNRAIRVRTYVAEDRKRLVVEVQDEGSGITRENLSRLTDPFFTTKRDDGGTGLGLAVSLGIAHEHGGDLEFHSESGKGTTARLVLPLPDRTPETP